MAASPKSAPWHRYRFHTLVRRFIRHRKGSAVESALVIPVFLGALLGIMETGLLFLKTTAIDSGIEEAKRLTLTGQVSSAGSGRLQLETFRNAFCDQSNWIIDCAKVKFDVRAFNTFGAGSMPDPIVNGQFSGRGLTFNPGKPCQIVVVRAYYETKSLTAMIRQDVSNLNNGNVVLTGASAFKNEPFGKC
jgi:Flp pilus assembly protein TadG